MFIRKSALGLMLTVVWLCLTLTGCSSPSDTDDRNEWSISENLTIRTIAHGVWVHTSRQTLSNGDTFPANGLLVRNENELILVDTAWGAALTEDLLNWIDAELKLPVTRAVITHFHADSMGGAAVLAARGIPFIAHPLTLTLGASEGVPLPESISELEHGNTAHTGNVEVFYPGPGHSRDNLVVWLPEAKIVFGSCAVRSPEFPGQGNTADADVDNWPRAIQQVLERYPDAETVVPGHGEPGGVELLTHTIGLFDTK